MTNNANIAGHLPDMASKWPHRLAVIDPRTGRSFTFCALDNVSNRLAHGLSNIGIVPQTRVALMVPPGYPFFALTFALFRLGAVPVLIDPGMGVRGLGKCLAEADPQAFVGSAKAHVARRVFGWLRKTRPRCVHVGLKTGSGWSYRQLLQSGDESASSVLANVGPNDHAAILFTSGSTGPAKGAIYTHGMFQEQVLVLKETLGIEPGEVDLCTFPLFALFAPTLGMTAVLPDMDPTRPAKANPLKLISAIEAYRVTNLFGSPALVNVLGRHGEKHGVSLPTVRRVLSAGAPVAATVIQRMAKMLEPGVQVYTPYGATECLPVAIIGSDEILKETRHATDIGKGICVGRPVGRIEVRIIPINDDPVIVLPASLPSGSIGEITVRGPVVSPSYWQRPDADALHKIREGETTWHRTGDVGYLDDSGRLWFCGRKAHRVITAHGTLFTIPCEAVFNTHSAVVRTALVGVRHRGEVIPVICVEMEPGKRRLARSLPEVLRKFGQRFQHTCSIQHFLIYNGQFPVDVRHNAKINREQLAVWAARRLR